MQLDSLQWPVWSIWICRLSNRSSEYAWRRISSIATVTESFRPGRQIFQFLLSKQVIGLFWNLWSRTVIHLHLNGDWNIKNDCKSTENWLKYASRQGRNSFFFILCYALVNESNSWDFLKFCVQNEMIIGYLHTLSLFSYSQCQSRVLTNVWHHGK